MLLWIALCNLCKVSHVHYITWRDFEDKIEDTLVTSDRANLQSQLQSQGLQRPSTLVLLCIQPSALQQDIVKNTCHFATMRLADYAYVFLEDLRWLLWLNLMTEGQCSMLQQQTKVTKVIWFCLFTHVYHGIACVTMLRAYGTCCVE